MHSLSLIIRRLATSALLALTVFATSAHAVAAADAPNSCAAATTASPINTWLRGDISSGTDTDWYRFQKASTNFSLITLGALPKDYRLDLYNSSCTRLTGSNRPGFEFEEIYRQLAVGTYFARVAPATPSAYSTRQYALRLRTLPTGVFIVSSAPAYMDNNDYLFIPGEVLNNTGTAQQSVKITATYYNSANVVIKTDFTNPMAGDLSSRGRSPFVVGTEAPIGYHHYTLKVTSTSLATAPVGNLVVSGMRRTPRSCIGTTPARSPTGMRSPCTTRTSA